MKNRIAWTKQLVSILNDREPAHVIRSAPVLNQRDSWLHRGIPFESLMTRGFRWWRFVALPRLAGRFAHQIEPPRALT